ncbi:hypothetical protein Pmani_030331 [Petrolisthes manimaculis]|uniref:Uncharacterized protein n=1 Tax=Petrolisthes manimaculis TaxID=1843537 RepID=A0AAE1NXJ9_9EUCA|nr:hypothetical protein Pmani_030331 [Petrolisthes manimaculis]
MSPLLVKAESFETLTDNQRGGASHSHSGTPAAAAGGSSSVVVVAVATLPLTPRTSHSSRHPAQPPTLCCRPRPFLTCADTPLATPVQSWPFPPTLTAQHACHSFRPAQLSDTSRGHERRRINYTLASPLSHTPVCLPLGHTYLLNTHTYTTTPLPPLHHPM